jgi:GNAT superfamily N-acetyltransferase
VLALRALLRHGATKKRRHRATNTARAVFRAKVSVGVPRIGAASGAADDAVWLAHEYDRYWSRSLAAAPGNGSASGHLSSGVNATWLVSCFVVRREYRGKGIGTVLLDAAVDWAAQHGASILEGHPIDTSGPAGAPSPSALFTGTLAMFQRAGFAEIGRTYPTEPVMRQMLLHR